MMLLSDFVYERQQKRLAEEAAAANEKDKAKVIAEGIVEGIAEGLAAAKAEGKAEAYREFAEWNRRRKEAAERGEVFTEPLPSQSTIT